MLVVMIFVLFLGSFPSMVLRGQVCPKVIAINCTACSGAYCSVLVMRLLCLAGLFCAGMFLGALAMGCSPY